MRVSPVCALWVLACFPHCTYGQNIVADTSGVRPGPIAVVQTSQSLHVTWRDTSGHQWKATFSLDAAKPLITAIAVDGKDVVTLAQPVYRCSTGKRSGGWDAFFDFPPANPAGTRRFLQEFHPTEVTARTVGDRVEVTFNGMKLGIFDGLLRYVFYPGTPLIQQVALMSTREPDTAYFYDAGLQMASRQDIRAGGNMASSMVYFDAERQVNRSNFALRLGAAYVDRALPHGGGEDGGRQHRRVSSAASLHVCARLHHQPGLSLVYGLAGTSRARGAAVSRRQHRHRSLDERAARHGAGDGPFPATRSGQRGHHAQARPGLHPWRPVSPCRWIYHLRAALASCLYRAGDGEGNQLGTPVQARDGGCGHRCGHDYGLPRRWTSGRPDGVAPT